MVRRFAAIALLATFAAAGCRAAGSGGLAANPQPIAPRPSLTAKTVVARINQNARLVKTFRTSPEITIYSKSLEGGVSGRLAMERPRNFVLTILGGPMQREMANLGSNDEGFWFWMEQKEDKSYFACPYGEDGSTPLQVTFQPDWIVEALGLREIPPEEAQSIQVERGEGTNAGALVLTEQRISNLGEPYTKIMIVDAYSGLLRELHLKDKANKPLTSARVLTPERGPTRGVKYRQIQVASATGEGIREIVQIPNQIELEWFQLQEKLRMVVDLGRGPEVNVEIPAIVFEEPEFPGYARVDLSKEAGLAGGTTTVRETRPAPPAGSGVRLGQPEPAPSTVDRTTLNPGDPLPLAADLGLARARVRDPEPVIGARLPTAPVPDALRATGVGSWGRATPRTVEP